MGGGKLRKLKAAARERRRAATYTPCRPNICGCAYICIVCVRGADSSFTRVGRKSGSVSPTAQTLTV